MVTVAVFEASNEPLPSPPVRKGEPGTIVKVPPGPTEKAVTLFVASLLLVYTKVDWAWTLAASSANPKSTRSAACGQCPCPIHLDPKSTSLNSSHGYISYG